MGRIELYHGTYGKDAEYMDHGSKSKQHVYLLINTSNMTTIQTTYIYNTYEEAVTHSITSYGSVTFDQTFSI
jgi:hypothetical protein